MLPKPHFHVKGKKHWLFFLNQLSHAESELSFSLRRLMRLNSNHKNSSAFLPATRREMKARGWENLDIILVTGDAYLDAPSMGIALIGRVLESAGFRVGVLSQPDIESAEDFLRLGEPELFWGVSAGSVDSMVANYTALKKKRKNDDFTPGGMNTKRPDRACIVYANRIRRFGLTKKPILLGGIEASLRRIAHYDFWDNKIRRSVLFDAKADYLLYGMAEESVLAFARMIKEGSDPANLFGLCRISREVPDGYIRLPSFEEAAENPDAFLAMFREFYANTDPMTAKGLVQAHGDRFLIQNPPYPYSEKESLDVVHELPFTREVHPEDAKQGQVIAMETIRHSITSHYGCYGECNFCAIAVHQGRRVRSRSMDSIVREAEALAARPDFKGIISDVGGPTANMYGYTCKRMREKGPCATRRCLFPETCPNLHPDHGPQRKLLRALREIPGIRKVFVGSGIRHDLILSDKKEGSAYFSELVNHHISGQMKLAPEHCVPKVLSLMGKPSVESLESFRSLFLKLSAEAGKRQFLTYYFIAAHPGCGEEEMKELLSYAERVLKLHPEQVQIFTPTPSTWSSAMYWTEKDPFTGKPLFVEKDFSGKKKQKEIIVAGRKSSARRKAGKRT